MAIRMVVPKSDGESAAQVYVRHPPSGSRFLIVRKAIGGRADRFDAPPKLPAQAGWERLQDMDHFGVDQQTLHEAGSAPIPKRRIASSLGTHASSG